MHGSMCLGSSPYECLPQEQLPASYNVCITICMLLLISLWSAWRLVAPEAGGVSRPHPAGAPDP